MFRNYNPSRVTDILFKQLSSEYSVSTLEYSPSGGNCGFFKPDVNDFHALTPSNILCTVLYSIRLYGIPVQSICQILCVRIYVLSRPTKTTSNICGFHTIPQTREYIDWRCSCVHLVMMAFMAQLAEWVLGHPFSLYLPPPLDVTSASLLPPPTPQQD
jgi:hypothetical protein